MRKGKGETAGDVGKRWETQNAERRRETQGNGRKRSPEAFAASLPSRCLFPPRSCPSRSFPPRSCPTRSFPPRSCPTRSFPPRSRPTLSFPPRSCPARSCSPRFCLRFSIQLCRGLPGLGQAGGRQDRAQELAGQAAAGWHPDPRPWQQERLARSPDRRAGHRPPVRLVATCDLRPVARVQPWNTALTV